MRSSILLAVLLAASVSAPAAATADQGPIRIGVLNDMSGVYADYQGPGSVVAAQMAVEDYGGKAAGRAVEVVSGDHQNKADLGASIARRWFDREGVDVVVDVPNSAVALAVSEIAQQKNKVLIGSGAGTVRLTGDACTPNTVHWTYDTWALAHGVAKAVVKRGGKSWFFITADYAFGHSLEQQASAVVEASGGSVLGAVRHPLGTSDFASYLLQAQASGADVVAFANAGGDLSSSLKQAAEFGLGQKQDLVGLIFGVNNAHGLGLEATQGLMSMSAFYWDLNDGTRDWSRRYAKRHPQGNMPNDMQAGVYAAVLHYLKAVDKVGGSADGSAVVAAMKAMPTDDALFGRGHIREDGRKIHPMYLLQVKAPAQSKGAWDYLDVIGEVAAEEAFRPLEEGKCPLVTN